MPDNILCCGVPAKKSFSREENRSTVQCLACGKRADRPTMDKAMAAFSQMNKGEQPAAKAQPAATTTTTAAPRQQRQQTRAVALSRETIADSMHSRMTELARLTTPFIGRDRPKLERLVANNLRYVMTKKDEKFNKIWATQEGAESIVHGVEEALSLGAELGKMGDLVPYGTVCEFIPAVEAFEFALTAGPEPPFKWIIIDIIHENDQRKLSRVNGEFSCSVEPVFPRGEVQAVAVYGLNTRLGHVIGEAYDAGRLLGKAVIHSPGYKSYKRQVNAFEFARTEGRVHTDGEGREYADVAFAINPDNKWFEKDVAAFKAAEAKDKLKNDTKGDYAEITVPKGRDGPWKKKLYRSVIEDGTETRRMYIDDLTNPYDGPDQAEMLRKTAGKSFLGKYARVRNSEAAMDEVKKVGTDAAEEMADRTMDAALRNMDTPSDPDPRPEAETVEAEYDNFEQNFDESMPVQNAEVEYEVEGEPDISDELADLDSGKTDKEPTPKITPNTDTGDVHNLMGKVREKAADDNAGKGEQEELDIY